MIVEPSSNGVRFGDWMGQLPASWSAVQIKNLGLVTLGKMVQPASSDPEDVLSPYLRAANVQPDGVLAMSDIKSMWFSPSERATLDLRRGDAVVVEGGIGGYGRAAYVQENLPGVGFQNSINRIRPLDNCDGRFITYCLIAARQRGFIAAYCNIVSMPHFTAEKLASMKVPAPPYDQQQQIADFLDRETARIDTLIQKQQQLIETLRERREAAIRRALTRGLNSSSQMTSSGISALGDIPAHWRVVPTRHLCVITTGTEDSGNATDDGEYPFYVRGREILRIGHYSFDCEAVMTPGDGQGGTGKVFHYVSGRFEAHQRVYVFKDFRGITGWYFYYFLSTFLRHVALAGSNTVTMESLRRPVLADFQVALPPLDEQRRIADYLDKQTAKIDVLIERAQRFIELSKERRSALIAAAVTGQIDVRETSTEGAA